MKPFAGVPMIDEDDQQPFDAADQLFGSPARSRARARRRRRVASAPAPAAGLVRRFETGATRDVDTDKLDYEGFLSPLVLEAFARFMHRNRLQRDGQLRAADNWQRGIPIAAYASSAWRHFMEAWFHHRGVPELAGAPLEDALCALLFNVAGWLHEVLVARAGGRRPVPTAPAAAPGAAWRSMRRRQAGR